MALGQLGSISITLSKVSVLLVRTSVEGSNQFGDVFAWLFVGCFISCAVLNLKVLNEGLAQFEAMLVIPIYYVVSTLLTMLAGELLYRTYLDFTRTGAASFASGVSLSLYGASIVRLIDIAGVKVPEPATFALSLMLRRCALG